MKRAGLLNFKIIASVVLSVSILSMTPAHAAIYSITQLGGSGAYAPSVYGQTFLVPAGKSGTISSVSNLGFQSYGNTVASVIWAKVWDSPSKSTLLATSTNTYTSLTNPSGWTNVAYFSLNFPSFTVVGGTTYYLEVGRNSGNGNFYIFEDGSNPYSGGAVYHDGSLVSAYDLRFQFDITLGVAAASPTITISSSANKGLASTITATTSVSGTLSFKNNGKAIPNCQKIVATGSPLTSVCNWKPPARGVSTVSVTLLPSDTSTYNNIPSASATIIVTGRSTKR